MHGVLQDLRYGVRQLRRSPVFALTAALSLAIGIGADTAIFTLVNGLLFRAPAGVADPDRLVDISRRSADRGRVLRLMLRRGMRVVMVGGAIGVLASAAIGRELTAAFHGFPSIDVVVLGGAVGLFALVAVVACYLPAHRATRINAIEALRCE